VTATAERLDQLLHRPLDDQRWLVVFLDGFSMGEHLLVGALGVTADGTKVPLGVVEGATENTAVCTRLVTGLRDRGLDPSMGCWLSSTAARPWPPRSAAPSAPTRSSSGAAATRNPTCSTTCPRPKGPHPAPAARRLGHPRPAAGTRRTGDTRPRPGPQATRRGREPARGPGRDPDRQPAGVSGKLLQTSSRPTPWRA
jgi:hypothetical protein